MTSNRTLGDWGKLLQDVPTAGAVLNWFLHHAQVTAITGESYRLEDSRSAPGQKILLPPARRSKSGSPSRCARGALRRTTLPLPRDRGQPRARSAISV